MNEAPAPPDSTTLLVSAVVFYLIMATCAVGALELQGISVVDAIFGDGQNVLRDAAIGVGAGGLLIGLTRLVWNWPPVRDLNAELSALLGEPSVPVIAVLSLTSGIGEELLFRGALQPWLGFWVTAILFGLLHGGFTEKFRIWALFAFLAGLLLGGLTLWTQNLLAAVICHMTVNYFNLSALTTKGK